MTLPQTDIIDMETLVSKTFAAQFKAFPTHIARAPGRVNLIGEHTDYNDGFVLPAAIDRELYIAGRVRDDNRFFIQSLDYGGVADFTPILLREKSLPHFTRFPRGVLWILKEKGYALRGMELTMAGNMPSGAGFSSSAAIEIAMLEISCALLGISMTQKEKALLGQQVEHQFIGLRSGVMDQMISATGQAGHAILIDCRSLDTTPVPVPEGAAIMTLDTGKRRELVNSEYGKRREQCEEAARLLGVQALRDVTPQELEAKVNLLPEVIAKRAWHVVNEDARTLAAVEALNQDDLATMGRLMNESHASLRDLYEVSIQELDIMADLAQNQPGCYGARMMGGGFGGAVIALVEESVVQEFIKEVSKGYERATRIHAAIYTTKAAQGSSVRAL